MTPNEEKELDEFEEFITSDLFKSFDLSDWKGQLQAFRATWEESRAALRAESEPVGKIRVIEHYGKPVLELLLHKGKSIQEGEQVYTAPQTLPIVEREEP